MSRQRLAESLRDERREKVVCHSDRDEMRVLREVVYIMESRGPRTEP